MYENIGGKIKTLAKVICWIGIIACVVGGIVLCCIGADDSYYGGWILVLSGVALMLLGPFFSWVGSFMLYGYGDLISRVQRIEENLYGSAGSNGESEKDSRIAELENLKRQGLITEEEFQNAIRKFQ